MKKKIFILPLMTFMFMSAFTATSVGTNPSAVYAEDGYTQVDIVGEPKIEKLTTLIEAYFAGSDGFNYYFGIYATSLESGHTYVTSDFSMSDTYRTLPDYTTYEVPSEVTFSVDASDNITATMITSSGKYRISSKPATQENSAKELFNPDSAEVDRTYGEYENPEATWDKASQTLTIEIKQQSFCQWGNRVYLSTGITTLDTSKEYQFSFTGTASTDNCGGVTFKAFDSNTLVYSNQNLPFTTTPYNYVSEWATPLEASIDGYLVFDFGWDAAQTVTITNISIKERSKVVSYTISDGTSDLNGIIEIDKSTAAEKELVTITVKPASGYQLKSLTAAAASVMARPITPTQDEQDKTKYTFTMPAHDVKVIAEFEVAAITATVAEIDCPTCHGDGLAQCSECFGLGCDACNGGNVPCTNCSETGKISFTTLEDAISAVTYYGKITLLKDNSEEIEISEEAVFIIDKASFTFDKSKITAGTGYDVSTRENGTETTFIVTHQKTIASILPEGFPTFSMPLSDKVWVNANCATSKLYKNLFNGLTFGSIEQYVDFQNILTDPVTKVENGYKFTKDSYTITFVMDDFDKLVQINLAGSEYADINGDYLPPHIHTLKETYPKVDAKCEEAGHEAYYECDCGQYFFDVDLTQEIIDLETWLAKDGGGYIPSGHNYQFSGFVWNEYTAKAKYVCSNDPSHIEYHDATITNAVTTNPTCTTSGVRTYTATYDGHTGTKTQVIPATGHTYGNPVWSWDDDFKATATFTCIGGDDSKVIEATVSNVRTEPKCIEDGKIVYTAKVEFEEKSYTDTKTVVLNKTGHHYSGEVTYTWDGDQCTAAWYCDHDGCTESESETVTAVYVKDTDATHKSNEFGHYEATFNNPNFAEQTAEKNSVELENTKLHGLSGGAIAGISIGSLLLICLVAYVSMFFYWKKKDKALKFLTRSYKWINKTIFKK